MKHLLEAFGFAVRSLREEKKISQEQLANMVGLHRTYISSVELGNRNISINNIYRIAKALNISMSDLIELCESKFNDE